MHAKTDLKAKQRRRVQQSVTEDVVEVGGDQHKGTVVLAQNEAVHGRHQEPYPIARRSALS
jgi:hypothetical protein